MFKGENLIGVLLAGLCLFIAGVMIWAMATDRASYSAALGGDHASKP